MTGKLSFIDNAVDTATGTVQLKAMFETPTLGELAKRIEIIGWVTQDTGLLAAEAEANLEEGAL